MPPLICRCCGGRMNAPSQRNPNLCLDCEQMVYDDSPKLAAETAQRNMDDMWPGELLVEAPHSDRLRPIN